MKRYIDIRVNGKDCQVPNAWEVLTSTQYLKLVNYLLRMDHGDLSVGEVRIRFLCDILGIDVGRVTSERAIENLLSVSEQLSFLFTEEDGNLELNLCFCAQLLPEVYVGGKAYRGYKVSTAYQSLTCSLTALQYLEARQLMEQGEKGQPLLAAILYYPGSYSSEGAQRLAHEFEQMPKTTLQAIALNFQAVNNFFFTKTPFSMLTKFVPRAGKAISTDATDALYDLSKDGLGDADQVERMNVLTYLRMLRKKTIEGVKSLKEAGMDVVKISTTVGLPLEIIREII